jgi:hypothetical protein
MFAKISMFEHFRGDRAYAEPIFCREVSEIFFVKSPLWSYWVGSLKIFQIFDYLHSKIAF